MDYEKRIDASANMLRGAARLEKADVAVANEARSDSVQIETRDAEALLHRVKQVAEPLGGRVLVADASQPLAQKFYVRLPVGSVQKFKEQLVAAPVPAAKMAMDERKKETSTGLVYTARSAAKVSESDTLSSLQSQKALTEQRPPEEAIIARDKSKVDDGMVVLEIRVSVIK
jgi:hypothetical protein